MMRVTKNDKEGLVYVVSSDAYPNLAKIGFSCDVHKRLAMMQVGNPFPLQIRATYKGTGHLERYLHRALGEYRTFLEWFQFPSDPVPFVNSAIAQLASDPKTQPYGQAVTGQRIDQADTLTPYEAAALLGVKPTAIRNHIARGTLRAFKLRGSREWRIYEEDVKRLHGQRYQERPPEI